MNLTWAYLTDVGVRRSSNEDAIMALTMNIDSVGERDTLGLFVISDGMGGKEKGELAGKIAVKTLGEAFLKSFIHPAIDRIPEIANYGGDSTEIVCEPSPANFLANAIKEANRRIHHMKRGGDRINMGATVTAGILSEDLLTIGHVGDCRCYLLYNQTFRQLTQDHTMVNDLIKQGVLSPEQARQHPQRSVLSRSLGSREELEVDTYASLLERGCRVLLCTDGLHGMVRDTQIRGALSGAADPREAVERLVVMANDAGGKDNVTVMVVFVL